ncbi:MAG: hypothetical protein ACWA6Y_10055 [Polaromonas sp.]
MRFIEDGLPRCARNDGAFFVAGEGFAVMAISAARGNRNGVLKPVKK